MPAVFTNLDLPILLLSSAASLPLSSPTTAAPGLSFVARQNGHPAGTPVIIPSTYGDLDDSPAPGVIVAIVLGSVAGFLVLLFLIYSALGFGPAVLGAGWGTRTVEVSGMAASRSVLSFRSRPEHGKHHRHHSRRGGGAHATEMFEVRTRERVVHEGGQPAPPIIVEPTRQPPSSTFVPPPPRAVPDGDEDEVVVIEEHSPPPRRKSRRHSSRSRRSDERRRSYRDGDPPREARRESTRRYSGRDYSREP